MKDLNDLMQAILDMDATQRKAAAAAAEERTEPPMTTETWSRMPSSRRRWSTAARASSMGMPTLSRMRVGAAPVPPR